MGREKNKIAAPSFSAGLIKKPCKGASAEKLASCKEAKKKHNLSVAAVEQFARMREDLDARGTGQTTLMHTLDGSYRNRTTP